MAIHIRLSELARELGVKVGFLLETLQKMGAYLEPAGTPNLLHAPERHARNPRANGQGLEERWLQKWLQ